MEKAAMKKVVTFGEIMLRLSPPGFQRFGQARSFDAVFGGGEANVSVSLANYGVATDFVTRLPDNDLGDACIACLRGFGVGTGKIVRGGSRIGIYFLEHGAVQRGSKVIYDRAGSAASQLAPGMIDWDAAFADADWFHWCGITPAVSASLYEACLEGIIAAKRKGLTVSCDLNYRSKLWKWGKSAKEVMTGMVGLCDVALANEEDAELVFGVKAPKANGSADEEDVAKRFGPVATELAARFPNLNLVGITVRGSISATHNTWTGVLYDGKTLCRGRRYGITDIVDRIGTGDAFTGGLIYGLRAYGRDLQKALDFAVAASCLKHSISGDFNRVTVEEVEKVMAGEWSGRVVR